MRSRSILVSTLVAIASVAAHANPYDPSVKEYATECFDKLHLTYDHAKKVHTDLAGPFQCKASAAKRLTLTVDGHQKDIGACDASKGSCPAAGTASPAADDKCDYPAWLELSDLDCYGNSYVQKIPTPSRKDVTAVLLCRHKGVWSDGDKDFDDIAMIVHNRTNGETCWFQAPDGVARLDGTAVPGPQTAAGQSFWLTPKETARIGCVGCHDNGPFMNSRWMQNSGVGISDPATAPYKNSTKPFDRWPEPRFVEASNPDDGLNCTDCHKIAAGGRFDVALDPARPGDTFPLEFQTCADCNAICKKRGARCDQCRGWIQRVTGQTRRKHPEGASRRALDEEHAIWMPNTQKWTRREWKKAYKRHVRHLMKCCAAVGKAPRSPAGVSGNVRIASVPGCFEYVPEINDPDEDIYLEIDAEMGTRAATPGELRQNRPSPPPPPEDALEEPPPDEDVDIQPPSRIPLETDPLPPEFEQAARDALAMLGNTAAGHPDGASVRCWIDKLKASDVDDRVIRWTSICPHHGPDAPICKVTSVGEAALAGISEAGDVLRVNNALEPRRFITYLRSDAVRKAALRPRLLYDEPGRGLALHHLLKLREDVALAETKLASGAVTAPGYAGIKAWIDQRKKDPKSVYQCAAAAKEQRKESAASGSCKWTSMDVVDPRIDDGAQQSLMRKLRLRSRASDRAEGSAMLGAIKDGTLEAIWKPYRPGVGARAQKLGKTGNDLIPAGRNATCAKEPAGEKPLIVYRTDLADAEIDAALSDAWKECGLPTPPPCDYEVVLKPGECSTHEECREKKLGWACVQHECVECAESLHCEEQGLSHKPLCDTSISTCVPFGLEISAEPPPVCQRCGVPEVPVCPEGTRCSPSTKCCENISQDEFDCIDRAVRKKFAARKKCQATEIEGIKQCVDDSRKCAGVELPPKPFDEDCFDVFESCVAKNPRFNKLECEKQAEETFRRELKACRE